MVMITTMTGSIFHRGADTATRERVHVFLTISFTGNYYYIFSVLFGHVNMEQPFPTLDQRNGIQLHYARVKSVQLIF